MASAVITVSKVTGSPGYVAGNRRVKYRDITADTGDYTPGGFTLTAAQFGLRHLDFVSFSGVATDGTSGATAQGLGVSYGAQGTSVTVQVYESGAGDAPLAEKGAEAYPANFAIRARAEGY